MVKKILFLLIALIALSYGEMSNNWNGYLDTIKMPACTSTVLIYSKTPFSLTDYDMVRIICHVDDTTSAGFKSDSIKFKWGYQTFSLCADSGGKIDTCYSPRVTVDTISTDSLGKMSLLTLDGNAIANSPSRQADTLSCAGWAVQSRTFSPEWDIYSRLWIQGLTGNKKGAPLRLMFTVIRRLYRGSRAK